MTNLSCTIWKLDERLAELGALSAVRQRDLVPRGRMPECAPGHGVPGAGQHPGRVAEAVRPGEPVGLRDLHAGERDLRLPDRPERALAVDPPRVVAGSAALDEEALDLAVGHVAGPDHHDIGDGAVADPLLLAVEHPAVALAPRRRLQADGVRAVVRLGQREGPQRVDRRQLRQPALLLLLGAEHRDRLHGQAGLDAEEGAETAVATVELEVHQAGGDRAHRRAAVAVDPVPDQPELAEAAYQLAGEVRPLPVVVDHRKHLVVDEAPGPVPVVALLCGQLVGDAEEVGPARAGDVLEHGLRPHLSST